MGKIVATWLVKVTAREPDDVAADAETPAPPTNDDVAAAVTAALGDQTSGLEFNATSERTDR